jgi:hypothetical protein
VRISFTCFSKTPKQYGKKVGKRLKSSNFSHLLTWQWLSQPPEATLANGPVEMKDWSGWVKEKKVRERKSKHKVVCDGKEA